MSKPSSRMERFVAGVSLFIAFLVMASVFAPSRSHAGSEAHHPPATAEHAEHGSVDHAEPTHTQSEDPHAGLPSMGSLETGSFGIAIFGTGQGPRYSIYDRSGELLGTLLSADQVGRFFPDLALPELRAGGPQLLMLAE